MGGFLPIRTVSVLCYVCPHSVVLYIHLRVGIFTEYIVCVCVLYIYVCVHACTCVCVCLCVCSVPARVLSPRPLSPSCHTLRVVGSTPVKRKKSTDASWQTTPREATTRPTTRNTRTQNCRLCYQQPENTRTLNEV